MRMKKPYKIKVPEDYHLYLRDDTCGELVRRLMKEAKLPVLGYTKGEVTLDPDETAALSEKLIIQGFGFELYAVAVRKDDGSKVVKGEIVTEKGANIDHKRIEEVIADFSIRDVPKIEGVPAKPGTPTNI